MSKLPLKEPPCKSAGSPTEPVTALEANCPEMLYDFMLAASAGAVTAALSIAVPRAVVAAI